MLNIFFIQIIIVSLRYQIKKTKIKTMTQVEFSIRDARQVLDYMRDAGIDKLVDFTSSTSLEFDSEDEDLYSFFYELQRKTGLEIFID